MNSPRLNPLDFRQPKRQFAAFQFRDNTAGINRFANREGAVKIADPVLLNRVRGGLLPWRDVAVQGELPFFVMNVELVGGNTRQVGEENQFAFSLHDIARKQANSCGGNVHTNNCLADNCLADNCRADNCCVNKCLADNERADNERADNERADNERANNGRADNDRPDNGLAANAHGGCADNGTQVDVGGDKNGGDDDERFGDGSRPRLCFGDVVGSMADDGAAKRARTRVSRSVRAVVGRGSNGHLACAARRLYAAKFGGIAEA